MNVWAWLTATAYLLSLASLHLISSRRGLQRVTLESDKQATGQAAVADIMSRLGVPLAKSTTNSSELEEFDPAQAPKQVEILR